MRIIDNQGVEINTGLLAPDQLNLSGQVYFDQVAQELQDNVSPLCAKFWCWQIGE